MATTMKALGQAGAGRYGDASGGTTGCSPITSLGQSLGQSHTKTKNLDSDRMTRQHANYDGIYDRMAAILPRWSVGQDKA